MLTGIAGVLVLLSLLLAIPVNLVYALKKEEGWRGRIVIYWMFGLVHLSLRPGGRRKGSKADRLRRTGRGALRAGKTLARIRRDLYAILRTPGFVRRLIQLVRDLLATSKPRRFHAELVVGLEDPADTGRLWGMLAPFRFLLGKRTIGKESNVAIKITPDFSGPRFTGYSCASIRFVPLRVIGHILGFVFSPPIFRAARSVIPRSGA
jgi:hypothetical protein